MNNFDNKNLNADPINNTYVIALIGPTAIGKTELSLKIAEDYNCEIIGVDSMQIYRFMDIGTAKPTYEERKRVPHHLIDFVDPADHYNVSRFINDANIAVQTITSNKHIPLLTGGTGLYLKGFFDGIFNIPSSDPKQREKLLNELKNKGPNALHQELTECDPKSADRIHINDTARLLRALEIYRTTGKRWADLIDQQKHVKKDKDKSKIPPLKIGLYRDRQQLYDRINLRVNLMIDQGLINEVENLLTMGYSSTLHSMQSLGYRHILNFLSGKWSMDKTIELLARDTRRYAKRQKTWFAKDSDIHWFEPDQETEIRKSIDDHISTHKQPVTH